MSDDQAACSLCERDIDLLLLEEFYCSPEFRAWFLERVTSESGDRIDFDAKHSVKQSLGETDLEVWFSDAKGIRWVALIENKINADFQKEQPERYKERALQYKKRGEADQARTVLISPTGYEKQGCALFDIRFYYEDICEWLMKREGDVRATYKAELIAATIKKAQDGYQPKPDLEVSDFWQQYWTVAERQAPQLRMPKPGSKPTRAGFVRFDALELPSRVQLIHKLRHGHVDLEFSGFGKRLQELQHLYGIFLKRNMSIQRASGSGAIRIEVCVIDPKLPFTGQAEKVSAAISEAHTLLDWFRLQMVASRNPPA